MGWGQVLEFLILNSSSHIHGKLAMSACPVLLMLVYENPRLRTRLDGEGDKAGLATLSTLRLPLVFQNLLIKIVKKNVPVFSSKT